MVWEILAEHGYPPIEFVNAHWVQRMRLKEEFGRCLVGNRVATSRGSAGWTMIGALCVGQFLLWVIRTAIVIDFPVISMTRRALQLNQSGRRGHFHLGSEDTLPARREPVT
jgi:hypothetical protein